MIDGYPGEFIVVARKAERVLRADDVLEIEMAAGGGFVAVIQ